MDKQEFTALVNSYGSDLKRWPKELHEAAKQAFAKYPGVAEQAAELDDLLDSYMPAELSPAFIETLVGKAAVSKMSNVYVLFRKHSRMSAAALAACAVLGFWTGSITVATTAMSTSFAQAQTTDSDSHIEKMILGPTQVNEVLL